MPAWLTTLLGSTEPSRRRLKAAVIVGIIGGFFSAIVKFGWEVPFPPRTPERQITNPPQAMLEWFGMSHDQSHATVSFSHTDLPIMSFIVHFSFAIVFALIYCVGAEYFPRIKMWQGAVFGIVVYVFAHVIVMPLLGWAPNPFPWADVTLEGVNQYGPQSWSEHFSEFWGHIIWLWAIEVVRRDIRNRITHEPDAEVPLAAATR